jgi:hypothetical protein
MSQERKTREAGSRKTGSRKHGRRPVTVILIVVVLLASCILPLGAQAQDPDPYEPDELNPPWIANDELQERSFYPDGDVDYARFRVKAGRWYNVHTQDLSLIHI